MAIIFLGGSRGLWSAVYCISRGGRRGCCLSSAVCCMCVVALFDVSPTGYQQWLMKQPSLLASVVALAASVVASRPSLPLVAALEPPSPLHANVVLFDLIAGAECTRRDVPSFDS